MLSRPGDRKLCPIGWEAVIDTIAITNKDGRAKGNCFALVGVHKRDALRDKLLTYLILALRMLQLSVPFSHYRSSFTRCGR